MNILRAYINIFAKISWFGLKIKFAKQKHLSSVNCADYLVRQPEEIWQNKRSRKTNYRIRCYN